MMSSTNPSQPNGGSPKELPFRSVSDMLVKAAHLSKFTTSHELPLFDEDYVKVERVLCTPTMYPLIHQSGMSQVKNTWKEECLRVLEVLLNIRKDNVCFGIKFSAYDP